MRMRVHVNSLRCILLGLICGFSFKAPAQVQTSQPELTEAIETAIENDDFFQAEILLKKVPSNKLEEPRFLVLRAMVEKGFYRIPEAEQHLKAALRQENDHGDALFEMALIQMEKQNWFDADVLLRLASDAQEMSQRRRSTLPYYLGVASFESGRIFDSKNSFVRLNWHNALDPALERSAAAYLTKIARERPWSLVTPFSYQYESNILGLSDAAELPEGSTQRFGSKLIAGAFFSMSGLGGDKQAEGPWGAGFRLLTTRAIESQFESTNVFFLEAESNWTRLLNEKWGVLRLALVANWVRVGGESTSATVTVKSNLRESELSLGYDADIKFSSPFDRSSFFLRGAREFQLWERGSMVLGLPVDMGIRLPRDKENPGEMRTDVTFSPTFSVFPSKRLSLKLSQKLNAERISDALTPAYFVTRIAPGLTLSYTAQPYLIVSGSASYEFEKNTIETALVRKTVASLSVLGLF